MVPAFLWSSFQWRVSFHWFLLHYFIFNLAIYVVVYSTLFFFHPFINVFYFTSAFASGCATRCCFIFLMRVCISAVPILFVLTLLARVSLVSLIIDHTTVLCIVSFMQPAVLFARFNCFSTSVSSFTWHNNLMIRNLNFITCLIILTSTSNLNLNGLNWRPAFFVNIFWAINIASSAHLRNILFQAVYFPSRILSLFKLD